MLCQNESETIDMKEQNEAAVAAGSFPSGLLLPAECVSNPDTIAARVDDIPLLVEYLIERYAKKAGKKIKQIRKQTLELFQASDCRSP